MTIHIEQPPSKHEHTKVEITMGGMADKITKRKLQRRYEERKEGSGGEKKKRHVPKKDDKRKKKKMDPKSNT